MSKVSYQDGTTVNNEVSLYSSLQQLMQMRRSAQGSSAAAKDGQIVGLLQIIGGKKRHTPTKEIQVLKKTEFLGKTLSVFGTVENPLFLAKEVAEWLEHSNARMMLQSVDDDGKVVNNVYTPGGNQDCWFLTENGLYEVLMLSRKPIAKEFKRGVKKILKEIRQNGCFATADTEIEVLAKSDIFYKVLTAYTEEKLRADMLATSYDIAKRTAEMYKNDCIGTNKTLTWALNKMKQMTTRPEHKRKNPDKIDIFKRTELLGKPITVFGTKERPLFWAKEIRVLLGFSSTPNMVKFIKDGNKFKLHNPQNIFGGSPTWFITEDGLNELFYRYGYCGGMDIERYRNGIREIIKSL